MAETRARKTPLSAGRSAACRQNGRKSKGPKSEAGEARSRGNAVKHGLAGAGVVLPPGGAEELARKLEEYRHAFGPRDAGERDLVRAAAHAAWKAQRCQRGDVAEALVRVARAELEHDLRRPEEHHGAVGRFYADPAGSIRALMRGGAGLDWMIGRWRALRDRLVEDGAWDAPEIGQFRALMEHTPWPDNNPLLCPREAFFDHCKLLPGTPLSRLVGCLPPDHPSRVQYERAAALEPEEPTAEEIREREAAHARLVWVCDSRSPAWRPSASGSPRSRSWSVPWPATERRPSWARRRRCAPPVRGGRPPRLARLAGPPEGPPGPPPGRAGFAGSFVGT